MNATSKLRVIVASVILGVWVVTVGLNAFWGYDIPGTVHGLMMAVAVYLFGPTITGRGKSD
jgi:hypothetical protein